MTINYMLHTSSTIEYITVRGMRYCIRHWGDPDAPAIFLLHGWMDSSATFQFVVDALKKSWHLIAPDWRGYGQSEWLSRPYWFPDYYADLQCILDRYSPEPARLVGHSMGASIASVFAGVRPERVSQLVMIDFLGLTTPADADAATQLSTWLESSNGSPEMRGYDSCVALSKRLMSVNPRLTEPRATFLSQQVSYVRPDGLVAMACDPWHKISSPYLYRVEDTIASWKRITAPTLLLVAEDGLVHGRFDKSPGEVARRLAAFKDKQIHTILDSSHNVQHDQPEQVALHLEHFLKP